MLCLTLNPELGAPFLYCYTEYWGKLVLGIKKNELRRGKEAFDTFLKQFDLDYYENLITRVALYHKVRFGLSQDTRLYTLPKNIGRHVRSKLNYLKSFLMQKLRQPIELPRAMQFASLR